MSKKSVKMLEVTKIIHMDESNSSCIILGKPADWKGGTLKVMGNFRDVPKVGETFKVSGDAIVKEPWLDENGKPRISEKSGKELFNYVMNGARVVSLGKPEQLAGKVESVLWSNENKSSCIALVQPRGWKYPTKVYLPEYAEPGGHVEMSAYKDREPWLDEKGQQVKGEDGKNKYNIVYRATEAKVRNNLKEYSGPISRVFTYNEENGNAIVLMNPGFKGGRDVKAYGAMLTIRGFTQNEPQMKDGKPVLGDDGKPLPPNLVIEGVDATMSPAPQVTEAADPAPAEDEEEGPSPGQ